MFDWFLNNILKIFLVATHKELSDVHTFNFIKTEKGKIPYLIYFFCDQSLYDKCNDGQNLCNHFTCLLRVDGLHCTQQPIFVS